MKTEGFNTFPTPLCGIDFHFTHEREASPFPLQISYAEGKTRKNNLLLLSGGAQSLPWTVEAGLKIKYERWPNSMSVTSFWNRFGI